MRSRSSPVGATSKPDMRLSLSVSGRQLRDASLTSAAQRRAPRDRRRPRRDLPRDPEGAVGEDPVAAIARSATPQGDRGEARARRLRLGRVPFSYLRELPIDALKINESFIRRARRVRRRTRRSWARWSSSATRSGSAWSPTASSTEAQLELLRELGCDAAQGDLIGPPVTAEQARGAAGRRGR